MRGVASAPDTRVIQGSAGLSNYLSDCMETCLGPDYSLPWYMSPALEKNLCQVKCSVNGGKVKLWMVVLKSTAFADFLGKGAEILQL